MVWALHRMKKLQQSTIKIPITNKRLKVVKAKVAVTINMSWKVDWLFMGKCQPTAIEGHLASPSHEDQPTCHPRTADRDYLLINFSMNIQWSAFDLCLGMSVWTITNWRTRVDSCKWDRGIHPLQHSFRTGLRFGAPVWVHCPRLRNSSQGLVVYPATQCVYREAGS